MSDTPRDPRTPAEWQAAVNAAQFCLLLDACYRYGLITGPPVNVDRCLDILRAGAELGYLPVEDVR